MRILLADYDAAGVYVYQAFKPQIVQAALELGTFGSGFGMDRMTWIKPSFGWMLQRSGYASKHRQEAIARIHLSHAGFLEILAQAVPTEFVPALFDDVHAWKRALKSSNVRYQWDPDRDLVGRKLVQRAIQLGLSGSVVYRYVHEWILDVHDVTPLAHEIYAAIQADQELPKVFTEQVYPLPPDLAAQLHCSSED